MSRKIVIHKCADCPFRKTSGGYGRVAYMPSCGKAQRDLPYTKTVSGAQIVARMIDEIPVWCPLEDD